MLLAGCASTPEHTNTLLFGTTTKVALDVSSSPVAGGTPSFTLGYKRHEGVLLPLLANKETKEESEPAGCTDGGNASSTDTGCLFIGTRGKDTYSVLASFGLRFGSGSKTSKGELAQFFATGMAAQKLAEKGGAQLVSSTADLPDIDAKPPSAKEAQKAYEIISECVFPKNGESEEKKFIEENWIKIVVHSSVENIQLHIGVTLKDNKKKEDSLRDWLSTLRAAEDTDIIKLAISAEMVCNSQQSTEAKND